MARLGSSVRSQVHLDRADRQFMWSTCLSLIRWQVTGRQQAHGPLHPSRLHVTALHDRPTAAGDTADEVTVRPAATWSGGSPSAVASAANAPGGGRS